MATPVSTNQTWRFDAYEVDTRRVELRRNDTPIKLREQSFLILVYLLEHAGEIVTREELQRVLWPSDTYVDFDHSLNMAVMKLRDALGDSYDTPLYIETIPKRGYRFIASVLQTSDVQDGDSSGASVNGIIAEQRMVPLPDQPVEFTPSTVSEAPRQGTASPAPRIHSRRWAWAALGSGIPIAMLAMASWYLSRPLPPPQITDIAQITHDNSRKWLAGTDGARFYFGRWGDAPNTLEVAITGGEAVPVPIGLSPPGPWVFDVSPDGSALLVCSPNSVGGGLWSVQIPGGSLRHLTDSYCVALMAAWSPDGKSVVYQKQGGGIYVVRSDGTDAHRLGSVKETVSDLALSPDGSMMRFTLNHRIWEMSSDGSGLHEILPGWRTSSWLRSGHWTPDGRFFEFSVYDPPLHDFPIDAPYQLWARDERSRLFRLASAEPVRLTSGPIRWDRPYPSSDGKKIFDRGVILRGELLSYGLKSHQIQPYLGGISAEFLSFSPDGQSVAYVTFPEGILWRANRDGSSPMQLTGPPLYPLGPRWSPDGTHILFFASDAEGHSKAYVVSSTGGTPRPILPEDTEPQSDPDWSPDGSKIVFAAVQAGDEALLSVIRILDVASHNVSTVPGSGSMRSPRWSPDGRFIAALYGGQDGLKIFNVETQKWSVLREIRANTVLATEFPTWSRDGQFIYFLGFKEDGVLRIRPSGGDAERVVDIKGFRFGGALGFWMGLDPEDAPLLLRDTGTDDIYALNLETE